MFVCVCVCVFKSGQNTVKRIILKLISIGLKNKFQSKCSNFYFKGSKQKHFKNIIYNFFFDMLRGSDVVPTLVGSRTWV